MAVSGCRKIASDRLSIIFTRSGICWSFVLKLYIGFLIALESTFFLKINNHMGFPGIYSSTTMVLRLPRFGGQSMPVVRTNRCLCCYEICHLCIWSAWYFDDCYIFNGSHKQFLGSRNWGCYCQEELNIKFWWIVVV